MARYKFDRVGGPYFYPALGYSVVKDDVVELGGALDPHWTQVSGSTPTTKPDPQPVPNGSYVEPQDGYVLTYDSTLNRTKWTAPVGGGVASVAGKTGVVSLVKADIGLANVDNTADSAKPVSTAQATAIAAKATKPVAGLDGKLLKWNNSTGLLEDATSAIQALGVLAGGAPDWATTTAYKANQIVMFGGVLYRSNLDHTSAGSFDPTKWTQLGTVAINSGVQKLILGYNDTTQQLYFDPAGPPSSDLTTYRIDDAGHLFVYKGNTPVPILTQASLDSYVASITTNAQTAVSAATTAVDRKLKGRVGVAFMGDSLTNFWYPSAEMWHNHLAAFSGGYLRHRGKFALGGITLATMQSTYLPTILALDPKPGACVIVGGTNDISDPAFTVAGSAATLTAICDALEAAGIQPVCGLIPPRGDGTTYSNRTRLWNAWVRRFAQFRGYHFVDLFTPMVDPATGGYKAGMGANDNIHPTLDGHMAIASYNLSRPNFLAGFRVADGTPRLTGAVGDTANIVGDIGLFTSLTGGGGANATFPNGWTAFGNFTTELVDDGQVPGKWFRLHRSIANGSGNAAANPVTPPTVSAGDVVSLACKFRLNYLTANHTVEAGLRLSIVCLDGANAVLGTTVIYGATQGVASGTAYGEAVMPAGTVKIKPEIRLIGTVNDDASYVDIAQFTVENLTSQGTAIFTTAVNQ